MDQRKLHLQNLGICYRFYHFITKTLASQALKTVTLGRSTNCSSTSTAQGGSESKPDKVGGSETPCNNNELPPTQGLFGDSISSPPSQAVEEMNDPCMKVDEMARENKAKLPQTKSLKKSVSISDNVEEIPPYKKMKKRSKSFKKSGSLDQEEEEEEPKPLRSILKVGSDLNDNSNSIC